MEFTNKSNFPQYIVDWLISDNYDYNEDPLTISATTLMKPTKAVILSKRYKDQLKVDVSDLIASSLGGAIHDSIETVETPNVSKETRVSRLMSVGESIYSVTGKYDILEQKEDGTFTLRDVKTTSVWAYIYGGKDEDYRKQLSIYRWLLSIDKNINDVGFIDFFFTDWQSSKAKMDSSYPQQRLAPGYRIELMSVEETEAWIKERLTLVENNKDAHDENLPPCTRSELWMSNDEYAVMKKGAKRATKLCDSREEALAYMKEKEINGFVQLRPAKVKRCNYCPALPFCSQGLGYQKKGLLA